MRELYDNSDNFELQISPPFTLKAYARYKSVVPGDTEKPA